MKRAAAFAGHCASYGVFSISTGERLVTILGGLDKENEASFRRLAFESSPEYGQEQLEKNPDGNICNVLVHAARLSSPDESFDALIIEAQGYGEDSGSFQIALPYSSPTQDSSQNGATPFAIHQPRIFSLSENWQDHVEDLMDAFFRGVATHEEGSRVWRDSFDDSI